MSTAQTSPASAARFFENSSLNFEFLNLLGGAYYGVSEVGACLAIADQARDGTAKGAVAACVHPILSGSAVERICNSEIEELVITDTIPLGPQKQHEKIKVLSLAPLLGEAITRINSGRSVGELFQ